MTEQIHVQCTFESEILRRIYGPIQDKNTGVLDGIVKFITYYYPYVKDDIKIRRLGWVGHIIRMEDERIPKKVFKEKLCNTRLVGKPRKGYKDIFKRDTSQILGVRRWRNEQKERRMEASSEEGMRPKGAVAP
jgi:hypothetical protein